MPPKAAPRDVFMNHAFGPASEYLYLTLISGLVSVGMNPRSVVQIPASQVRIDRLFNLISQCAYSIHDLSYVTLSRDGFRVPRFNMAFELGLAMAIAVQKPGRHQIATFEAVRHRLGQSLSDVSGYDPYIHRRCGEGVLEAVLDVFTDVPDSPLEDIRDLNWVYRSLRRVRRQKFGTTDIFRARPFSELVFAARALVEIRSTELS